MTNRQTCGDGKIPAKKSQNIDFSKFAVHDSFSIPATDNSSGAVPPDSDKGERRLSRRKLIEIDNRLSDRDHAVLITIRKYRYLMTGQVERLLFTGAANNSAGLRAASRNLKKLKDFGLIDCLARRIGGVRAGSGSLIWYITHAGERLLRLCDQNACPIRRHFEPSAYFLAHTLAVAEMAIRFTEICRKYDPEITALELEPECWREYSRGGVFRVLKPDLYLATTNDEYEDYYFIEIDLDTESPAKIIEKCGKYHDYYCTSTEQEEKGVFPLTIWLVPSKSRKEKLLAHIREAFDKKPMLFAIVTEDELEHLLLNGGERGMLC